SSQVLKNVIILLRRGLCLVCAKALDLLACKNQFMVIFLLFFFVLYELEVQILLCLYPNSAFIFVKDMLV
ncbi:hypothetical protein Nmel_016761, partial [Mimus melanotis]